MQPERALYDVATVRALEQRAAAALGDAFVLMERAGAAAWRALLEQWPSAQRIAVVCGPGNNGGDGYVLAAHARRSGRRAQVVRVGEPGTELARRAMAECVASGCAIEDFAGALPRADVLVDALFGIGLTRPPQGEAARAIDAMCGFSGPVLALDVPSGVDADTGNVPGNAVAATLTLQMLAPHRGLATGAALDHIGIRSIATLKVARGPGDAPAAEELRAEDLGSFLPVRPRNSHKGMYGHVLCLGGERGSGGAIALCAEAALRSGAGLVSVGTRAEHVAPLLARRPELMPGDIENAQGLSRFLERASVVAIGPGLGQTEWAELLLRGALASRKPLVLDADALNLLARQAIALPADAILTPHPGEAARLLGIDTQAVQADRFAAAAALVARFGCVAVLKGAGTIVASPSTQPSVVGAGNPGMASGGMGDLLTGTIASLRAQGLAAFDAARCGALLHGAAGDVAAGEGGERGLLATDLLTPLRRLANPGMSA